MMRSPKFLLVGCDGLRPDLVDPELTPNLRTFLNGAFRFANSRAVFPTETFPNTASLMTGAPPSLHGVVANRFFVPALDRRNCWSGFDLDSVERFVAARGGHFHDVPTMGDRLGDAGMRLWTISTGSTGSARLLHPSVDRYAGHLCLAIKGLPRSRPTETADQILAALGPAPAPAAKGQALAEQSYATEAFLWLESRHGMPDVAVLWYAGTDHALHAFGLGARKTRAMLGHVDAEFGRLLTWWRQHPERESIQVVLCSDHGHVTETRRIDVDDVLARAGFRCGRSLEEEAELVHLSGFGGSGTIRVRRDDPDLLVAVCQALMAEPGVGALFTAARNEIEGVVPGTFAQSLIRIDHQGHAGDIDYGLAGDASHDPFGYPGTCWSGNPTAPGGSTHGSLHPRCLSTLLAFAGSLFREDATGEQPAGIGDIAPTLLCLLGLETTSGGGRVLREAWAGRAIDAGRLHEATLDSGACEQRWRVGAGDYEQELIADGLGRQLYFREGKRIR